MTSRQVKSEMVAVIMYDHEKTLNHIRSAATLGVRYLLRPNSTFSGSQGNRTSLHKEL